MAKINKHTSAKIRQILEYMDGPQAVLLERSADQKIVAVAIDKDGYQGYECPFFGAAISLDQWERYRRGFLDLRFLFMFPRWREWYIFDLKTQDDGSIEMSRVPKDSYAEKYHIPEPGFFAYDHSEPIKSTETEGLATQKFNTDGVWDLPHFTDFYRRLTDIYVFFLSLKKILIETTPLDEQRRIRDSFMGHPLRGGSSYVNLYAGLLSAQDVSERLSVGKLQYASPGEVDVRGRFDIFAQMRGSLDQFERQYEVTKRNYNDIHNFLAKNKLLRADADRFDNTGPLAQYLLDESFKFSKLLSIDNAQLVYELTGSNALKFSKILLSYFRRLETYFMYFAEGRVTDAELIAPD
jgi:hypothetical protein